MCNLSELELLRVDNNRLARLPDHISRITKLIGTIEMGLERMDMDLIYDFRSPRLR